MINFLLFYLRQARLQNICSIAAGYSQYLDAHLSSSKPMATIDPVTIDQWLLFKRAARTAYAVWGAAFKTPRNRFRTRSSGEATASFLRFAAVNSTSFESRCDNTNARKSCAGDRRQRHPCVHHDRNEQSLPKEKGIKGFLKSFHFLDLGNWEGLNEIAESISQFAVVSNLLIHE